MRLTWNRGSWRAYRATRREFTVSPRGGRIYLALRCREASRRRSLSCRPCLWRADPCLGNKFLRLQDSLPTTGSAESMACRLAGPRFPRIRGAGAAAGGLAITRVLGLHHLGDLPTIALPGQTQSPAPTGVDWVSPLDKPEAQVAHLLRRATFGATPTEYAQSVKDGFKKTVDRLVETKAAEPPALAGADDATQDKPIKPQGLIGRCLVWMIRPPPPFTGH